MPHQRRRGVPLCVLTFLLLALNLLATARAEPPSRAHLLRTAAGEITCLAWSPDDQRIAAGTKLGLMHVWAAPAGGKPRVFDGHGEIKTLAWSKEANLLRSVDDDDYVRIWNLDNARVFPSYQSPDICSAWSGDGEKLAATYTGTTVWVWNGLSKRRAVILEHPLRAFSLAWDAQDRQIAVGTREEREGKTFGAVTVWNAESGERARTISMPSANEPSLLTWSSDGQQLAAAAGPVIHVVSPESGKETATLRGHDGRVSALAWSPDNQYLLSAGDDHEMRLWSSNDWKSWKSCDFQDRPSAAAWSHDGRWLAVAAGDSLYVWDPRNGITPKKGADE